MKLASEFWIGDRRVANGAPPFVIAEAGSNFNQDLDTAYRLIDTAAEAGADAVKFQLFRAESPEGTEGYLAFKAVELNPDWVPDLDRHATAAIAAVARGAAVIEKHFTLDRTAEGPDHSYALEPQDLKRLVAEMREAHQALGAPEKEMLPEERRFGRRDGLYAARDIAAGETISAADVAVRRPALGLRARHRDAAIGARARRPMAAGDPIYWDNLAWSTEAVDGSETTP